MIERISRKRTGSASSHRPMHDLQLQSRTKQRRARAVARRKQHEIGRADKAGQAIVEWRRAIGLQREAFDVAPRARLGPGAAAPDPQRPARLADDGLHNRQSARRAVAGQDGGAYHCDAGQPRYQFVERGRRNGRHAAGAGDDRYAGALRIVVERGDAGDEYASSARSR